MIKQILVISCAIRNIFSTVFKKKLEDWEPLLKKTITVILVSNLFLLSSFIAKGQEKKTIKFDDCETQARCKVTITVEESKDSNGPTVYIINQPAVAAYQTPYYDLRFHYFDEIYIEAGGCVQTGGRGNTWKQYVDPQGPNSDRLYFGLIQIPGVTADLDRIANYIGGKRLILLPPPHVTDESRLYLTLGYMDDDYGDNGYGDHDDGTGDQCKGVGPAWVKITIYHHSKEDCPGVEHPKAPMDVWWDEIDDNFLPISSMFGEEYFHKVHPNSIALCAGFPNDGDNTTYGDPPCTLQWPYVDEANGGASLICHCDPDHIPGTVHGHVNWFNVSYWSNVFFHDWGKSFFEDDDLDLMSLTSNGYGVMNTNPGDPHLLWLEFKYSETLPFFDTPWWDYIKQNIGDDGLGWQKIREAMDGKKVYISGLFGIDTQHGGKTEMHPVHFFAIRFYEDKTSEKWAFFARNAGNEGFCSQNYHILNVPAYNFFIPNARDINSGQTIIKSINGSGCTYRNFPDGILFSFPMPTPIDKYCIWHGEISVNKLKQTDVQAVDPQLVASVSRVQPPKENYQLVADELTKREMRRWRRKYYKEMKVIEGEASNFLNPDISLMTVSTLAPDQKLERKNKELYYTDKRDLAKEAVPKKKPDIYDQLEKNALYVSLKKAIKNEYRFNQIISKISGINARGK